MNETLHDFVIGNNTNESAIENDILEPRSNKLPNNFGTITVGENSALQDQVIDKNNGEKVRKAVDNAVMTVVNLVHDAILTAMDNMVILRVQMAPKSITESSR